MNTDYLVKRLWNLGYAIREIDEAKYMQSELEHELFNIMFANPNPSNDELVDALNELQIYKRSE